VSDTWVAAAEGPRTGQVEVSVTGTVGWLAPNDARKLGEELMAVADEVAMATRWCDHCGGAVRESLVLPGLWVHLDELAWSNGGSHRARLRKIEGEVTS